MSEGKVHYIVTSLVVGLVAVPEFRVTIKVSSNHADIRNGDPCDVEVISSRGSVDVG